ncbi:DUF418 domain-containing protein [Kangiella sediminilitoris]|uniref:DUF418 domain-containing protein n=1 Tax=Kangiella sediminilitoris TaxID=1144748 RepID=A0A1B3BCR9_9GAMM|nr:DUF418 domain-containing protein [Kangiella sediminilitoris]AOE50614.1 hypothetical protein KS2013_1905 [Kangiella sediminilitoris]
MATLEAMEMKSQRLGNLDVLRGIVILAILIININYFSTPSLIRYNPLAYGDFSVLDQWVWLFEYGLVKQRFMTLLALLYGVGIMLFVGKYQKLGVSPTKPFVSRSLFLLLFGLAHAYLIWDGDILVAYALCGLIVFWLRNLGAVWLIGFGLTLSFGVVAPDIWNAIQAMVSPPATPDWWIPDATAAQQAASQKYNGSWWELTPGRVAAAWDRQSLDFIYFTLWRCSGLMMLGMGLWKVGALTSPQVLKHFSLWGLLLGLVISLGATWYLVDSGFSYSVFVGINSVGFYIGSIVLALGYLGFVMLWGKSSFLKPLQNLLAKAGRMAFTLYIMQSVICGIIFYGYGFDLFGQVSRSELWIYTVGIWGFQLLFVIVWFNYFKRGPLEGVWRKGYEWAAR